jgi:hypothetical protein
MGSGARSPPTGSEADDLARHRRTIRTATAEEVNPMFAPNLSTHQLADTVHHERQSHAALPHRIARDRDDAVSVDRGPQRGITSRRLAALVAAAMLTFVIAAAAAANQPAGARTAGTDATPAQGAGPGGGMTLVR